MIQITGNFLGVLNDWIDENNLLKSETDHRINNLKTANSIPMRDAIDCINNVLKLSQYAKNGTHIGWLVRWKHLGALGHMLVSAESLEDMLYRYAAFERLFYGINASSILRGSNYLEISWPQVKYNINLVELTLSGFIKIVSSIYMNDTIIHSVCLPYKEPEIYSGYGEIWNCPVYFNDDCARIRFNNSSLILPVNISRIRASDVSSHIAMNFDGNEDFILELTYHIIRLLPERMATIEYVSEKMFLSKRTLQRRLSGYLNGFSGVVDNIRQYLAEHYLHDSSLNLLDISRLLGYSEQSAFNLAFRRWNKLSPLQWKKIVAR